MKDRMIVCDGDFLAFWEPDLEHKTFKCCSNCGYVHKLSNGALPDTCPDCGYKMAKGGRALRFYEILQALQEENNH